MRGGAAWSRSPPEYPDSIDHRQYPQNSQQKPDEASGVWYLVGVLGEAVLSEVMRVNTLHLVGEEEGAQFVRATAICPKCETSKSRRGRGGGGAITY